MDTGAHPYLGGHSSDLKTSSTCSHSQLEPFSEQEPGAAAVLLGIVAFAFPLSRCVEDGHPRGAPWNSGGGGCAVPLWHSFLGSGEGDLAALVF